MGPPDEIPVEVVAEAVGSFRSLEEAACYLSRLPMPSDDVMTADIVAKLDVICAKIDAEETAKSHHWSKTPF